MKKVMLPMESKKVFHICVNYLSSTVHSTMIKKLDEQGIDNYIYVPINNDKYRNPDIKFYKNVIIAKCFNKIDRLVFDFKQHKMFKFALSVIPKNIDYIHAYTLFTDGNLARKLSKKFNVPYIVAIRNTDVNIFFKYMFFLRGRGIKILLDAKKIFFLSMAYKKQVFEKYIPKRYHVNLENKIKIIPNGINEFWIDNINNDIDYENRKIEFNNNKIKLLYVGEITENKNVLMLLQVSEKLFEKGYTVTLTVVGVVKNIKIYNQLISKKYVVYIKNQKKEKLIDIYRNNDIFVMPSFTETFGLVYAEAMTQGLPLIYTKGQGFDEQFAEGEVGFHVNPYDSEEIMIDIIKIINKYYIMSNNCLKLCKRFSWTNIAKEYIEIYNS